MPSTLNLRQYLVLAAVTLTAPVGDTFLSVGMKRIGPISLSNWHSLMLAVFSPWVAAGIVLLLGFFASYLTALSWADLTFVLPATSIGYVVVELLSKYWLHERISFLRWLGVLLIVSGVGFVTRGPAFTQSGESQGVESQGPGDDSGGTLSDKPGGIPGRKP